ncbi:hypothetical protein Hanom_Chr04g00374421 [Helianthus anomalus]
MVVLFWPDFGQIPAKFRPNLINSRQLLKKWVNEGLKYVTFNKLHIKMCECEYIYN